jgi:MFS family permease
VLVRSALFMVFGSALWALLPAVARVQLRLDANGYGLLLAGLGVGAVLGAIAIPWLRRRFGSEAVVTCCSIAYALSMFTVGVGTSMGVAMSVLLVGGIAWVAVQSTYSAAAQVLLPGWTRARGLAYFQLVYMGGQALGALVWGALADAVSLPVALAVPAAGLVLSSIGVARLLPLPHKQLDLTPAQFWPTPPGALDPDNMAGPVLVAVEWPVRPDKTAEFVAAMRPVGRSRRRTGATMWGLFQDLDDPSVFVETFVVPTWHEHLRQHLERGTVLDQRLEARACEFLVPGAVPGIRHLVWAEGNASWSRPAPSRHESPHAG